MQASKVRFGVVGVISGSLGVLSELSSWSVLPVVVLVLLSSLFKKYIIVYINNII